MAQAQFLFFRSKLPLHIFLSLSLSLSKDHGEGDEGDEGHEEERDREGEAREDGCVPWDQGKDWERAEEERFDEEQEREDREPEACEREEGLHPHQGLDRGRDQGAQVPWPQGLHRGEEGLGPLQEGEGVLWQLSSSCVLSRQGMMIALL